MTPGPEPSIEDRLRAHYQHLRELPSVAEPDPPSTRARFLAIAAGLSILLALGGAYLANRAGSAGDPLRADVGSTGDDPIEDDSGAADDQGDVDGDRGADAQQLESSDEPGPPATAGSGSDEGAAHMTPEPEVPEPESDQAAIARPDGLNADGSPVAPAPGTEAPPEDAQRSAAYGVWQPGPGDTCSQEVHDRYWVYGPDGKVYPTHHPPVDPVTGCTFGHEHGRDPAGSDLADIPFPFGYVNEQLLVAGGDPRPAEHVSHKIEWYDDGGYYEAGSSSDRHDQICDVAYKFHLDSHSAAAFDNNEHEVFLYARCENGSELIYRALHRFGRRGEFELHCDQGAGPTVVVGAGDPRDGDRIDGREIPASQCFEDQLLVEEGQRSNWFPFDERWILYQSVDSADFGRFFIQLQLFVDLPARYWDGDGLARTVDLCYLTGDHRVREDDLCGPMLAANPGVRVSWDDPASPFDGTARRVFMGDIRLDNEGAQNDWYTDVNGEVWSSEPFPGSIRQYVGVTAIDAAASYRPDPIRSIDFPGDLGIHPPN